MGDFFLVFSEFSIFTNYFYIKKNIKANCLDNFSNFSIVSTFYVLLFFF